MKIFESEKTLAFLDIGPVSRGHSVNHKLQPFLYSESWRANTMLQLIIPKHHGAKLTDIPDDALLEILVF